jgi:hypothetical protein
VSQRDVEACRIATDLTASAADFVGVSCVPLVINPLVCRVPRSHAAGERPVKHFTAGLTHQPGVRCRVIDQVGFGHVVEAGADSATSDQARLARKRIVRRLRAIRGHATSSLEGLKPHTKHTKRAFRARDSGSVSNRLA